MILPLLVMGGAMAYRMTYLLFRKKVLQLPARDGCASWETLLKRMRYRGSRKQRSATRRVLSAVRMKQ